ncbi:MAG TPA: bile acid:sodium symporter [Candidatus Limnocylindrales bacterium]
MAEGIDLNLAQTAILRIAVVAMMVSLGLRVSLGAILASGRRWRTFGTTLVLALIVVPLSGWLAVRVLGIPAPVAAGIVLVACAPGGSLGPKLVDLADGDVALALALFFTLAVIAPVSLPITAALLSGADLGALRIDVGSVLLTLVAIQLLPLLLATLFMRSAPGRAADLGETTTRLTTLLLFGLIGVAVINNLPQVIAVGPAGVLALGCVAVVPLVLGLLLGRDEPRAGRTVALVTGQRSTTLGLLISTTAAGPAATGAVIAGGLVLLVVNPLAAVLLARRRPLSGLRATADAPAGAAPG